MLLLQKTKPSGARVEIISADHTFMVVYRHQHFNVRQIPRGYGTIRYRRTSFKSLGHAERMADALNEFFATQDFTVVVQ